VIVVADTSVILNLCRIEHEHLLLSLFRKVVVPIKVAAEFERLAIATDRFAGLRLPHWIEQRSVQSTTPARIEANLDPGEIQAIALCLDLRANLLLIDESLGRAEARRLGVKTLGILGVLLEAKRRGLTSNVGRLMTRLTDDAGFWIAPDLRNRVLSLAGE
jgi:predicted nucleic acid-binding protein